jgi:hypothetical protein
MVAVTAWVKDQKWMLAGIAGYRSKAFASSGSTPQTW